MVEAVTLTTMMVALVRICCRFSLFLHLSRLLPSSWGREAGEGRPGAQGALEPLRPLLSPGLFQVCMRGAPPASPQLHGFTAHSSAACALGWPTRKWPRCPHPLRLQV